MTASARLLHPITLADGQVLATGSNGEVLRAIDTDLLVRFDLPGVPGAFSTSTTLRVDADSLAVEACGHAGCQARAWSNGWCFTHQEEGGFGRPPTMRGTIG